MPGSIIFYLLVTPGIILLIAGYVIGIIDMTYNQPEDKKVTFPLLRWELFFYFFDFKKESSYKLRWLYRLVNLSALVLLIGAGTISMFING